MKLMKSFFPWLRAMALLRHPELLCELGELRLEIMQLNQLRLACPGGIIERGVVLVGYQQARCRLEPQSRVCRGTVLACGDDHGGYGRIEIGARTWIGQYNNFRVSRSGNIQIGADCLISQFCTLVTAGHGLSRGTCIRDQIPAAQGDIVLGNDVWIGAGVTLMPGVTIGDGAVVGANSVVTGPVPSGEIWAGSPARKIGARG